MFEGSMVALVTPMHGDGAIDWNALKALIGFHLDNATDAIVAVGTTGESATLDDAEHRAVIRYIIESVARQVPVIAGTGANSTREAIDLTRFAHDAGADAALLVTPYYNKPTQEGLYQHYKTVAESVPIPQILYNVPGRTACDMLPETVARLAEIDNIVGLKEATNLARVVEVIERCNGRLEVYSGDDINALEVILQGGRGVISVTANVVPRAMHDMCAAALNRDQQTATTIDRQLDGLHRDLFLESNPIPVKWALHQMHLIPAGIRLPLTPLSARFHDQLFAAMRQAGVWFP